MKIFEIEFSATVKVEASGDTDEIIKAGFEEFIKKVKQDLRTKKDMREMFAAIILHEVDNDMDK